MVTVLNIREAAFVSGIREAIIKQHIRRNWLPTVNGFIDEYSLCLFCNWQRKHGVVQMWLPDRLVGRISEIDDWGFEWLYKNQEKPPWKSTAYLIELRSKMMETEPCPKLIRWEYNS